MKTIGDRIKHYLTSKGMKPIDLHKKTGISTGLLSAIINNKRTRINSETLFKIAQGLGVHPGALVPDQESIKVNGKTIWLTYIPGWEKKGYTPERIQEVIEQLEKLKLL